MFGLGREESELQGDIGSDGDGGGVFNGDVGGDVGRDVGGHVDVGGIIGGDGGSDIGDDDVTHAHAYTPPCDHIHTPCIMLFYLFLHHYP